jgi:uncharacterized protein YceK
MKRFALVLVVAVGSLAFVSGCRPLIHNTTVKQQRPAVKAAYESSRDAEKNWDAYSPSQKKKFLELNTKSWDSLNRVYNPKK